MPATVANTSTMRPVRHGKCHSLIEWCRHVSGAQVTSSEKDYLWCPTCKTTVTTNEIVPPGSVCLVFD